MGALEGEVYAAPDFEPAPESTAPEPHTPILHAAPTQVDDEGDFDRVLMLVSFALAGVCSLTAVMVICFSEASRRAWRRAACARNAKVELGDNDDVSETTASFSEVATVAVPVRGASQYDNVGLAKPHLISQQNGAHYESADSMLASRGRLPTTVYNSSLPARLDESDT